MATAEYSHLLKMGFSKRFLKTPAGSHPAIRQNILRNIGIMDVPVYYCPQCRDKYVRTIDLDKVDNETIGPHDKTPGDFMTLAQAAGFCSSKCMNEMGEELGAENIYYAAKIALRPDFYESPAWRKLRYTVLMERGNHCECCGSPASQLSPIHVDHIKPRYVHPYLALTKSNLQVLCKDCNFGKGAWDETDWRDSNAVNQ